MGACTSSVSRATAGRVGCWGRTGFPGLRGEFASLWCCHFRAHAFQEQGLTVAQNNLQVVLNVGSLSRFSGGSGTHSPTF